TPGGVQQVSQDQSSIQLPTQTGPETGSQIAPSLIQETGPDSGVMKFGQAATFERGVQQAYSDLQSRDNIRIQEQQKGVSQSPVNAGFQPSNKITAEEMTLLKNQIKFHIRGIREGRIDEKKGRIDFVEDIKRVIGKQQLPAVKQSAILNKAAKTNILNPVQVKRTLNYVDKVVNDAAYTDRVSEGKDLAKRLKS